MQPSFVTAVFQFVLLLFSITVHECAHAWTASRLGDQTARMMGRVSLNPVDHIDPIGTLLLPALIIFGPFFGFGMFGGVLIGWAKPVPIVSRNFRNYKRDDMLVSVAGPIANLLLGVIFFLALAAILIYQKQMPLLEAPSTSLRTFATLCNLGLQLNLTLCIFNLIPIPPLDGSHILRQFLPYNAVQVYDRISGIASYLLIILAARMVLGILLHPVYFVAYAILDRI